MNLSDFNNIQAYLTTGTLPPEIKALHLSGQYRFKKKAEGYTLRDGKLLAKGDFEGVEAIPKNEAEKVILDSYSKCPFGPRKIYQKLQGSGISRKSIEETLQKQESYQLHQTIRKPKVVRSIRSSTFGGRFETDLIDMSEYAWHNNGFKWILTVIDIHSRMAWAVPLKSKSAASVAQALEPLLKEHKPQILQSDNGKEFTNASVESLCKSYGIKQIFISPYYPQSNGAIERFNGTLKRLIFRTFTLYGTKIWHDKLEALLEHYNQSKHSTTGTYPITGEAIKETPKFIRTGASSQPEIQIGAKVRLSLRDSKDWRKKTFKKYYTVNWSKEIYEVSSLHPQGFLYRLKGMSKWYPRADLLPIPNDTVSDLRPRPASSSFDREAHLERLHAPVGESQSVPEITEVPLRRSTRTRRRNTLLEGYITN